MSILRSAFDAILKLPRALLAYAEVFEGPIDFTRYAALRQRQNRARGRLAAAGPPVELRVRTIGGGAVLCRPSQDVWTFKHTFLAQFHLPPVELRAHATILDLGSNVGYTVAHLAHVFPTARVIGVEMDAANFALAQYNTAAFGDRVALLRAAVWTHDGEIAYSGDEDDAFTVSGDVGSRRAPSIRIDTLLNAYGVDRVDYVKMDIEGAEAAIVAEPAPWLDRVDSLKIEVHPPATLVALRAVLEGRGFTCSLDEAHPRCLIAVRA
ncbi:MAG: FkbM family methyltransferase [Gemmatimonadaceae bacterium]